MTDIGTGTYTVVAQVAADALGVPIDRISVVLARSDLPKGAGSGGSFGAPNAAVAVHRACEVLKRRVSGAADIVEHVRQHCPDGMEAIGKTVNQADDPNYSRYSQNTYGASFAEVGVEVATGEVRLRRMLGVFAAGRIINPKTARSQLIGGMICLYTLTFRRSRPFSSTTSTTRLIRSA